MSDVYVAIGSNVDPEENISKAATELARVFPGARFSPWYRNRAVGFEGDDFINLVCRLLLEKKKIHERKPVRRHEQTVRRLRSARCLDARRGRRGLHDALPRARPRDAYFQR